MEDIVIRKAENVDIPRLVEVRLESLGEELSSDTIMKLSTRIEGYFVERLNDDLEVFVAESKKEFVAIFCLSYLTLLPRMISDNNVSAYLSFYYIKPEYYCKSLKEKLFKEVINSAKAQKAEVFELAVPKEEIPTYARYGFAESEFFTLNLMLENIDWNNWKNKVKSVQFRKAEIQDIQVLVNMRTQFLYEVAGTENIDTETEFRLRLTEFLEQHLNGDVEAFIAEDNGEIISVCFTIYFDLIVGKLGLPVNAYTLPAHRGKGIAKALFAFAGNYAERRGTEIFETQIPKESFAFCSAFGFELTKIIPIQLRL